MNPVPLIATAVPTPPLVGEKLVIVSPPEVTTKLALLVPVPAGVVTEIFPVVAPLGTVVWMLPGPITVNGVAEVPLNRTAVAPVKFAPKMWTVAPTAPLSGLKLLTAGIGTVVTLKSLALTALPPGVCTEIGPSVAPVGTSVVICVPVPFTLTLLLTPLNCTWNAPVKLVPLIVTLVPTGPLEGVNPEMLGGVPAAAGNAVIEIRRATIAAAAPKRVNARVAIDVRFI